MGRGEGSGRSQPLRPGIGRALPHIPPLPHPVLGDPDTDCPQTHLHPPSPRFEDLRLTSREGGSEVIKEGKAPALGDWVEGMAAPGGHPVPQVEEGKETSLPRPQRLIPLSWRVCETEPRTGLILLSQGRTGSSPSTSVACGTQTLETFFLLIGKYGISSLILDSRSPLFSSPQIFFKF